MRKLSLALSIASFGNTFYEFIKYAFVFKTPLLLTLIGITALALLFFKTVIFLRCYFEVIFFVTFCKGHHKMILKGLMAINLALSVVELSTTYLANGDLILTAIFSVVFLTFFLIELLEINKVFKMANTLANGK